MNKNFLTIFKNFSSVHLGKDVGLIPEILAANAGIYSQVFHMGEDVKSDKLDCVSLSRRSSLLFYFKVFFHIVFSRSSVVNLYHFKKETYFLAFLSRIFGKKVYVKLDIDNIQFEKLLTELRPPFGLKKVVVKLFCLSVNLFSVENKKYFDVLNKFPIFSDKIFYLPNGPRKSQDFFRLPLFGEREDIVLVAGRLGAEQKDHRRVLEWIESYDGDRRLRVLFAGPVEDNELLVDMKAAKVTDFISIEYVGCLDKKELFSLMKRSKFFLSTSRWEGFSLAMAEAAVMGLFVITTPVSGSECLTKNGDLGLIFDPSKTGWVDLITEACCSDRPKNQYAERVEYFQKNFIFNENVMALGKRLEDI